MASTESSLHEMTASRASKHTAVFPQLETNGQTISEDWLKAYGEKSFLCSLSEIHSSSAINQISLHSAGFSPVSTAVLPAFHYTQAIHLEFSHTVLF